ncbi:hypothetical protein NMG60_11003073 [Bertholletia excelsa]
MKFFSELGSCFGGATVAPAAESAAGHTVTGAGNDQQRGRRLRKAGSSSQWRPALSAISEDGGASDVGARKVETAARSPKKAKSTAVARSPRRSEEYNRIDSVLMALPAFSPTPFMF